MALELKLQVDMVAVKIEELHGNVAAVARTCGVARGTIYRYIHNHSTLQTALKQARETMIDNVESVLYKKALEGEGWAVCFFLKTQGKNRGYVERQEFTGENGKPVKQEVRYSIDPESAVNIFDILARAGALGANTGDAAPDEVHLAYAD